MMLWLVLVTRFEFTLLGLAIALLALAAMWWGWRGRARRDRMVLGAAEPLTGDTIAVFDTVQYVSTTPVGEPLVRVAAPGLRYRGPATVTVRRDGVSIAVAGEHPVAIALPQIDGTGNASRRVGKAVEHDGLGLLIWRSGQRALESGFRFAHVTQQQAFFDAVGELMTDHTHQPAPPAGTTPISSMHTTQEDA